VRSALHQDWCASRKVVSVESIAASAIQGGFPSLNFSGPGVLPKLTRSSGGTDESYRQRAHLQRFIREASPFYFAFPFTITSASSAELRRAVALCTNRKQRRVSSRNPVVTGGWKAGWLMTFTETECSFLTPRKTEIQQGAIPYACTLAGVVAPTTR